MTACVVDASVMVKWLVPEEHSDKAVLLRDPVNELFAPDHFRAEVANAVWKKLRRGELTLSEAGRLVQAIALLPVSAVRSTDILDDAFELAAAHNRSVYDSLYVALALREQCQFVTADRRLFNALSNPLGAHLLWVEDIAAA